jgi:hypothetical protein
MTLSRPLALLVGVLTLWPVVYLLLFFGFVATSFLWVAWTDGPTAGHSPVLPLAVSLLFGAHFATILLMFVLIAFYIAYLFKTDRVPQDKKALWAVVLFLGNMLTMPVFFYLYVWPSHRPTTSRSTPIRREPAT